MDYNIIRTNFNEINPLPQEGVQLTPQVAQSLYLFTELSVPRRKYAFWFVIHSRVALAIC